MALEARDHKRIAELSDLAGTLHGGLERLVTPPGGAGERSDQERRALRAARDAVGEARWRIHRIQEGRLDRAIGVCPPGGHESPPGDVDPADCG